MDGDANIAALAAVLADPARCRVLAALGDGRALPASMLASDAGVAASTASEHLARLVKAGLLTVERHGRHRYFRLAGPHVSDLLEALARVAPPAPVRSLREGTRAQALRLARTCYDHLAGRRGGDGLAAGTRVDRGRPPDSAGRRVPEGIRRRPGRAARAASRRPLVRRLERAAPAPRRRRRRRAGQPPACAGLDPASRAQPRRARHRRGPHGIRRRVRRRRRAPPADPEVVELQQRGRAPPDEGGQSPPKGSGA
jgi:DNA-binding transcriptional ArsR family regulator